MSLCGITVSMERMTEPGVTESVVKQAALAGLESPGWFVRHDLEIASGEPGIERFIADPSV